MSLTNGKDESLMAFGDTAICCVQSFACVVEALLARKLLGVEGVMIPWLCACGREVGLQWCLVEARSHPLPHGWLRGHQTPPKAAEPRVRSSGNLLGLPAFRF